MSKKRMSTEQIISKLREIEILTSQGEGVAGACRKAGVGEQSFYRWRKEYGGRSLDKTEFLKKCFDLYENQVLQLKGGCENAIREGLRALGTKIVYHPNGKDGTIEVDPFVHSVED